MRYVSRAAAVVILSAVVGSPAMAQRPGSGTGGDVSDSLGLVAMNAAFRVLPAGTLTSSLSLGRLKSLDSGAHVAAVGPFAMGWTLPSRADGLEISFGFEWNAGEVMAREITDDATVTRLDIFWEGADLDAFASVAGAAISSLRSVPGVPTCLPLLGDVAAPGQLLSSAEIAWFADGWIGTILFRGMRTEKQQSFVMQFRAFKLVEQLRRPYDGHAKSWDCFPVTGALVGPFRAATP